MSPLLLGETWDEEGLSRGLYLPDADREAHLYVIGATGVGKSKAIASWALADLNAGEGFGVIDPHGDLIDDILGNAPFSERLRVIEFAAEEMVTLNPLERIDGVDPYRQTLGIMDVFRKVWELSEDKTPRLLEILRNAVWTLIETEQTLVELEPLLTREAYRQRLIGRLTQEPVVRFWRERFGRWSERDRIDFVESTLNKASAFTSDPRLRLMLGAKKSSISFRDAMDYGDVVLVDLSKGVLGNNTNLIGALLLSRIQLAAISRLTMRREQRIPWTLYCDEFQNFATNSFAEILSEARKMGLRMVLAHQTLAQIPELLRSTVLGNSKNFVVFRADRRDSELLARYVHDIDPLSVKYYESERLHFESVSEQWERFISDISGFPPRWAVLRIKGLAPREFQTLRLESDTDRAEQMRVALRWQGLDDGWLRTVGELDEELAVRSLATDSEPRAEPSDFWEPPRGSD